MNRSPVAIDDLAKLTQVHDPQSHGDKIAWVETQIETDKDTYASAIWVSNHDGTEARKLTSGIWRDANPRWSPDGSVIAFTSNRPPVITSKDPTVDDQSNNREVKKKKNPAQLWVIRLDGGEAQQITNRPYGVSAASWNSAGTHLVYSTQSDPEPGTAPMTNGDVADERIIRDMVYRFDGVGYREHYSHIYTVNIATLEESAVTSGAYFDSDPQWQPGGNLIAFSGNRRDDRKRELDPHQIFVVPASGGEPTAIGGNDTVFGSPSWSADGTQLAWLGHEDAGAKTRNDNLWIANADGSNVRNLSESWDVSVSDSAMSDVHGGSDSRPRWESDHSILALASQQGRTHIYRFDTEADDETPEQVTHGKRRIGAFAITGSGIVYTAGSISRPKELYGSDRHGASESQLSHANDDAIAGLQMVDAIDLDVVTADNWHIQGWLLPPANREEGKRYPVIVQIHGGPHGMYAYDFFHEMQAMSAAGYAVVFCNPRGSAGYGKHFCGCTRTRWGEADMPDVIATLETALKTVDWLDAERLGVTGGSYGGYLTNWIIGHDDRFKAAVTQRCVSNFHSFFGTSDIGVNFGEFEFGGVPWRDAELLLKYSPISYVEDIHTPLLIIHSENDLRCPIEQAEQMFTALKYLEREVAFVRVPEESHDLSRSGTPSRRKARLQHLIGWFDSHL